MSTSNFQIAGHVIGPNEPPFFIAAVNSVARNDGEMRVTVKLFKEAGADGVKGQDCTADTFSIPLTDEEAASLPHQNQEWIAGQPPIIYNFYTKLLPPSNLNQALFGAARDVGIPAISTAFDIAGAEDLDQYEPAALKVAAPDLFNPQLIERNLRVCAERNVPFICSAALGTIGDLAAIVNLARKAGAQLAFTIGPKLYGVPAAEAARGVTTQEYIARNYGLGRIQTLSREFPHIPLGIKDHSFAVTTVDGIKLEGYEMAAAAALCSHASFFIITAGVNRSADNIEAAYADSLQTFKRKVEMIALAVQRRQNKKLPETNAFLLKQAMERGDFVGCEPLDIGPSHAEVIMGEWGAISWGVAARDVSAGQTLTANDVHFSRINYNRVPAEDRTNLLPRAAAPQLLGNIAQQNIRKGMYLTLKGFQREIDPEQFVIGPKPKDHPVTTIA